MLACLYGLRSAWPRDGDVLVSSLVLAGSAFHLAHNGVAVTRLSMPRQDDYLADPHTPDVLHAMRNNKVDLFINFPRVSQPSCWSW